MTNKEKRKILKFLKLKSKSDQYRSKVKFHLIENNKKLKVATYSWLNRKIGYFRIDVNNRDGVLVYNSATDECKSNMLGLTHSQLLTGDMFKYERDATDSDGVLFGHILRRKSKDILLIEIYSDEYYKVFDSMFENYGCDLMKNWVIVFNDIESENLKIFDNLALV